MNNDIILKHAVLIKKWLLWAIFTTSAFMIMIAIFFNDKSMIYVRIGIFLYSCVYLIASGLELNMFNLKRKVPLINSSKISKHILFWVIVSIISTTLLVIPTSKQQPIEIGNDQKTKLFLEQSEKNKESENSTKISDNAQNNEDKVEKTDNGNTTPSNDATIDVSESKENANNDFPKDKIGTNNTSQKNNENNNAPTPQITTKSYPEPEEKTMKGAPQYVKGADAVKSFMKSFSKDQNIYLNYIGNESDGSLYMEISCKNDMNYVINLSNQISQNISSFGFENVLWLTYTDISKDESLPNRVITHADIYPDGTVDYYK